ncbi:MAG: 4Fe-4S dicluster domain-containing protein [Dehalobacter sp.]|nr:4Fe-4S dicluster domain-containing protein [Dehalobacter sp.]
MNGLSVPEKLSINKYELDESPHIKVDQEICRKRCQNRVCLFICPAKVYNEQNGELAVDHAGCLECGTCLVACTQKAIDWQYPAGGFGIVYRNG